MWYRFFCTHGGGHQSKNEEYCWFEVKPSPDELEEKWQEIFNEFNYTNATGDAEEVAGLPVEAHAAQVKRFKGLIEYAESMLKILNQNSK